MKYTLIFILLFKALFVIGDLKAQKFNYSVTGYSDRLEEGETVYLVKTDLIAYANYLLDSTIAKNGTFSFTGTAAENLFVEILNGKHRKIHSLILDSVPVNIHIREGISKISGSQDQFLKDSIERVMAAISRLRYDLLDSVSKYEAARNQTLVEYYQRLGRNVYFDNITFVDSLFYADSESFNSFYALVYAGNRLHEKRFHKNHAFFSRLSDEWKNHRYGKILASIIYKDTLKSITQIHGQVDTAGISLVYTFPAKGYTLIDFWASWCGHCRVNKKTLQPYYEKYHISHHFEIIGISLDDDEQRWKEAVEVDASPWVSVTEYINNTFRFPRKELQGYGNNLAILTGTFAELPQYFLLDPQGKIVLGTYEIDKVVAMIEKVHQ